MTAQNGSLQDVTIEAHHGRIAALEEDVKTLKEADSNILAKVEEIARKQREESTKTALFRDKLIAAIPSKWVLRAILVFVLGVAGQQCGQSKQAQKAIDAIESDAGP